MKKFIKLLLAGLLSISLIGCSGDSSNSSDEDTSSDSISETETSSDDTSETETNSGSSSSKVVTKSSGNVMISDIANISGISNYSYFQDIKTITFLDSFDALPFETNDVTSYDISANGDGCVMLYVDYSQDDQMYDFYIVGDGGVDANPDSLKLFCNFKNCISINFNDCFCTTNITDMNSFFYGCESLTSLDLSTFDTSNVTTMFNMFNACYSLKSLDVSNFDTSNVTNMQDMFKFCKSLQSLDLSSFNTSNVTTMYSMFKNCGSLSSLNVSSFDTSNVLDMSYMFKDCGSLTTLDISNFDMSNVGNNVYKMYEDCPAMEDD